MSYTNIKGTEIRYTSKEETLGLPLDDELRDYELIFWEEIENICKILEIEVPYLSLAESIEEKIYCDGVLDSIVEKSGETHFPGCHTDLDKPLVVLSLESRDANEIIGTLAHELRHIWQYTYHYDWGINDKEQSYYLSTVEIDADAFQMYYLTIADEPITYTAAKRVAFKYIPKNEVKAMALRDIKYKEIAREYKDKINNKQVTNVEMADVRYGQTAA